MSSPEHKQKIWNLISNIKTGMLTTRHGDELRSRPMVLVQDEYDGTLWFYTDLESEKVFELEDDNDVCVAFSDPHEHVYVSLTGKGRGTRDKALIDRYQTSIFQAHQRADGYRYTIPRSRPSFDRRRRSAPLQGAGRPRALRD